jgi:hypothetical protein
MKNLRWRRFSGAAPPCSEHDPYQTRKAQQSRALALERTWECKHYLVTTDTEQKRRRRLEVRDAAILYQHFRVIAHLNASIQRLLVLTNVSGDSYACQVGASR